MRLLLLVLSAALCCTASGAPQENIETLTDNVLFLRVPYDQSIVSHVPLTCGAAFENQPVFWKKDGVVDPDLQGNRVTAAVEEMNGGNYTCHLSPDGKYLNHTTVLVQLDSDRTVILRSSADGHIHCSAPNYKGSFHCKWTRAPERSDASVLLVKAARNEENIPCELDADGSGLHCQEDTNCSYVEEQHHISLTVYIHSDALLEAYDKVFYLRDIVRPEKIPNLRSSDGRVFSWNYPESWEKPCTFYGLQFQVKVVRRGLPCSSEVIRQSVTDKTTYEVDVKTRKFGFCVRAQDKHTSGPWSDWSVCTMNNDSVHC